jgi:hypothetical protein
LCTKILMTQTYILGLLKPPPSYPHESNGGIGGSLHTDVWQYIVYEKTSIFLEINR